MEFHAGKVSALRNNTLPETSSKFAPEDSHGWKTDFILGPGLCEVRGVRNFTFAKPFSAKMPGGDVACS